MLCLLILIRCTTPVSKNLKKSSYSALFLTASAADFIDFIEYIDTPVIVNYFQGVHKLMSKRLTFYSKIILKEFNQLIFIILKV